MMEIKEYRCPDWKSTSDLVGCGHTFEAEPDDDGWLECPNCGMHFDANLAEKERTEIENDKTQGDRISPPSH